MNSLLSICSIRRNRVEWNQRSNRSTLDCHAGQAVPNQINVIAPYFLHGMWVFDDDRVGLAREPFVSGIPAMIDDLVRDIPHARQGFRLLFSAAPFPGFQRKLTWLREEMGGNWYRSDEPPSEGWLCPALFRYFEEAPAELFVRAEPKT
jgi:hypothetical protein